jgi:hypothetical protein
MANLYLQADSPYHNDDAGRASYPQWMTDAIPADDEINSQRSLYKNPRNVPSDSCPRDEDLAVAQVSAMFFHPPVHPASAESISNEQAPVTDVQ